MFCLYCREYQGLDKHCRKNKNIHDFQEVLECTHYKYNGDVDGQEI